MDRCHIKNVQKDFEKVTGLVKVAKARIKALKQIKIDEQTSTIIIEQYYESIKELLTALLLANGKKSKNHEKLIEYFKKHYDYKYESQIIEELRKYRNKINYEGIFVKPEYLKKNKLEFNHIFSVIAELVEHQLSDNNF